MNPAFVVRAVLQSSGFWRLPSHSNLHSKIDLFRFTWRWDVLVLCHFSRHCIAKYLED